jgi:putative PIN family toxin of toxin-antitoxin system
MTRVVVDTDVHISAFVFGGIPRRALGLRRGGLYEFCISAPILTEIRRVLTERFDYSPGRADQMIRRLRRQSRFVVPAERIVACSDPNDDMILECAVAAKAKVIVTGDKALLRLDPFRGVRIVTPAQFLLDAADAP